MNVPSPGIAASSCTVGYTCRLVDVFATLNHVRARISYRRKTHLEAHVEVHEARRKRYEGLPHREYPRWKLRNAEVARPTLSLYCNIDVCAIPRVKGRNRKRGRDERVYAYIARAFYNFTGWIGIKLHCVAASAWRCLRAEWLHDKSSERESRDELTASRNKGAVFCDSAFSFIPMREGCIRRTPHFAVNNRR